GPKSAHFLFCDRGRSPPAEAAAPADVAGTGWDAGTAAVISRVGTCVAPVPVAANSARDALGAPDAAWATNTSCRSYLVVSATKRPCSMLPSCLCRTPSSASHMRYGIFDAPSYTN